MTNILFVHLQTTTVFAPLAIGFIHNAHTSKLMVGWDDDASHSQVICPSEDSESILCSNL